MKIEFFYRTSRGATAMKFFEESKARAWYQNQVKRHGASLPEMKLVKQTTIVKEEYCEPISSPTCAGRTTQQVSVDASFEVGIPRLRRV